MTNDTKQLGGEAAPSADTKEADQTEKSAKQKPTEFGGRKGPEPTRYGDWEKNGIISDF